MRISELAEEFGVSKQTIYNYIEKLDIHDIERVNGTQIIKEKGVEILREQLSKPRSKSENQLKLENENLKANNMNLESIISELKKEKVQLLEVIADSNKLMLNKDEMLNELRDIIKGNNEIIRKGQELTEIEMQNTEKIIQELALTSAEKKLLEKKEEMRIRREEAVSQEKSKKEKSLTGKLIGFFKKIFIVQVAT